MPEKYSKSTQYPGTTWSKAVNLIETIKNKFNGSAVSYENLADAYNVASTTRSFTGRLSGAKQYGLIETSGSVVTLTTIGREYAYPTSASSRSKIMFECVKKPKLFSDLIDRFNGKSLPTKELLGNILMSEYGILQQVKDIVADIFLTTIHECGFELNGVLNYTDNSVEVNLEDEKVKINDNPEDSRSNVELTESPKEKENNIRIVYPSLEGVYACIEFSRNATKEDLLGLRDMLDVFLKRQFKVSPEEL